MNRLSVFLSTLRVKKEGKARQAGRRERRREENLAEGGQWPLVLHRLATAATARAKEPRKTRVRPSLLFGRLFPRFSYYIRTLIRVSCFPFPLPLPQPPCVRHPERRVMR